MLPPFTVCVCCLFRGSQLGALRVVSGEPSWRQAYGIHCYYAGHLACVKYAAVVPVSQAHCDGGTGCGEGAEKRREGAGRGCGGCGEGCSQGCGGEAYRAPRVSIIT